MNHERALFPHNKLEWKINDLTNKSGRAGGNIVLLVQLMKLHLSRAMFHDGGEQDCAHAKRHGDRILQEDDNNVDAIAMIALSLVYLGRQEEAERYLAKGHDIDSDNTFLNLATGVYYRSHNYLAQTVEYWARALEHAPRVWEIHRMLGTAYLQRYHDQSLEKAHQERLGQRSLYHLIRALQSRNDLDLDPNYLKELGYACLINKYNREAERYFNRLRQSLINVDESSYYLGLVAYELGKFNNAVQHFRTYLTHHPDHVDIIAKKSEAWFHLGEFEKAKRAAQDCLKLEPYHLDARLVLGRSLVQLGDVQDAVRIFGETIAERPDHIESFQEVVYLRLEAGDTKWIERALFNEVESYSSLPKNVGAESSEIVRQRIGVVLGALMQIGRSMVSAILSAINCTQDEHLRFALWETVVMMTQDSKATELMEQLSQSQKQFDLELGCSALSVASLIPEEVLIEGVKITDNDIRVSALNKYDPAYDVSEHKKNEESERQISRGYQALLLLALAQHKTETVKAFLRDWKEQSDTDMSVAANIGLALNGELTAFEDLSQMTKTSNRIRLLSSIKKKVFRVSEHRDQADFLYSETEACQTCTQSGKEIHHFIRTNEGAICSTCITHSLSADTASQDAICVFCNRNFFLSSNLVTYRGVEICSTCQNQSQQELERGTIHQFFNQRSIYFGK